MGRSLEYPKRKQNTVNRYNSRARYDLETIHSIVNTTTVLHVAFSPSPDDPFPVVLPMIGVMASYDYPSAGIDEPMDCYIHGYVSARLMRLAKNDEKGLPVTISATKVDGLVLSLTPNSHSMNYRSAVLQGFAKPVESMDEKMWAMEQVTNSVLPQRWQHTRVPPDNAEMSSTQILRVHIESGSGKIRNGMPHDDAKDENREDVTSKVWTGVLPVYEAYGEPVPSKTNRIETVPDHITSYGKETTRKNEQSAKEATVE